MVGCDSGAGSKPDPSAGDGLLLPSQLPPTVRVVGDAVRDRATQDVRRGSPSASACCRGPRFAGGPRGRDPGRPHPPPHPTNCRRGPAFVDSLSGQSAPTEVVSLSNHVIARWPHVLRRAEVCRGGWGLSWSPRPRSCPSADAPHELHNHPQGRGGGHFSRRNLSCTACAQPTDRSGFETAGDRGSSPRISRQVGQHEHRGAASSATWRNRLRRRRGHERAERPLPSHRY